MTTRKHRVRHEPQISLGHLGEYMVASFVRQWSILRESKFPKDFIVAQYEPAQKRAARYLSAGGVDRSQFLSDIRGMLDGSERSRWYRQRETLCRQALDCLLCMEASLKLESVAVSLGNDPDHRLEIGGVAVTIVPDLILRGNSRNGPFVGALKLRYVKTRPVSERWAAYCSTILHQFVEQRLAGDGVEADRKYCRYVDVFAGKVYNSPESFKERRKEIEAACWQVKQLWPSITLSDQ